MSALELSTRKKFLLSNMYIIKRMNYFKNVISKLYEAVSAPVAATRDALAERLQSVRETAALLYEKTKKKLGYGQTLKDVAEEQAEQEHPEQEEENNDLTPEEHELAMNRSHRSFRIPGLPKADIDTYIERVKPYIKTLIVEQRKELQSAKVQMHMWVQWKKPVELTIELDPEDLEGAQDIEYLGGSGDNFIRVDKLFNSKMTEIFEGSNIDEILSVMFAYIKTQVENPALPKSGFTLDHIMHLDIDFHKLILTRGGSYIKLPEWIAKKKAIINPKNTDEECFKWAVIAALHHEEIGLNPERISKLEAYVDRYNWEGMKFPVALNKIGKFEKKNPDIAINVLSTDKNSIYIARRSKFNRLRSKQVNLLMVKESKTNWHYTAIKNIPRLVNSLNATHRGTYHYCINCLNGFRTESARDKHYEYCSGNDEVKIKMPSEKEKWLKYHQGEKQFRVPFMLYADFESILKPVEERYRDKMNQMKSKRQGRSYTEKVNKHVPSGWCVHSKFAYGEVQDPLTLYRGKDCVEQFVKHIESEVKRLHAAYPQQPMMELTEVLQREHDEATECHMFPAF